MTKKIECRDGQEHHFGFTGEDENGQYWQTCSKCGHQEVLYDKPSNSDFDELNESRRYNN